MKRVASVIAAVGVFATTVHAQIVVIDPANLTQTVLVAERTLREYQTLWDEYQTILRMAQSLGNMDRYRTPPIALTGHDIARFPYGAPWLQGLNSGDARGELYRRST